MGRSRGKTPSRIGRFTCAGGKVRTSNEVARETSGKIRNGEGEGRRWWNREKSDEARFSTKTIRKKRRKMESVETERRKKKESNGGKEGNQG